MRTASGCGPCGFEWTNEFPKQTRIPSPHQSTQLWNERCADIQVLSKRRLLKLVRLRVSFICYTYCILRLTHSRNFSAFRIPLIHVFLLSSRLDNELYSGTVADFSGSDPIIYRETLQTEQYDSLSLNGKICAIESNLNSARCLKWVL